MKPGSAPSRRKTEIREAALTLFAERGYHGTGMEDIAQLVGIRASSLYNHMNSKQELLADIMTTTMHELLSRFDEVTIDAKSPVDKLRLAVEAHVRYHATHRRDVRIGNREIPSLDEPSQTQVRQLRRDYARAWQRMIEAGVDMGDFNTLSPQLAAYALLEMGIGVSQWYREDGALSLDEIAFHYADMALRQLGVSAVTG
jgi:AcrR family transcriptional regulator